MTTELSDSEVRPIRDMIETFQRGQGLSVDEAAERVGRIPTIPVEMIDAAVRQIRDEARRLQLLKVPTGVSNLEYRTLVGEARRAHWYTGPHDNDRNWPALRSQMLESGFGEDAVESIDAASTKVVGQLADPGIRNLCKKGMVVGFVQSGKTANYAAVIAKGADAGYRLFIVLAGVHNALRSQTQARLARDVIGDRLDQWYQLTDTNHDFGDVKNGAALLASVSLKNLIVIKKNAARLARLRDWLDDMPENIRERCPALIIDDEADQATPNTRAAQDDMSKINQLTREVFELLPSGAYVGYTATPFANFFIDPRESDNLFPEDFIVDLPRPSGYFGAEELFGREPVDAEEDDVDGLDAIRRIPDEEAAAIVPPSGKQEREKHDPDVPDSLRSAVLWFVLCRAARRRRGHTNKHLSMLVHTSQYVAMHSKTAARVRDLLDELKATPRKALNEELASLWGTEQQRVPPTQFSNPDHSFADLESDVWLALDEIRVVIDNGQSIDRLDYSGDVPQVVIAVGGSTLSRGLTLEGLVVSYFLRNSKIYDTLLQMGRWFGFRVGYQDLPRIWLTDEMRDRFRFLATVEEEVRHEIRRFEREGVTPRQLAVKVRQHPSMAITAASKMHLAKELHISYGGQRKQTFRFDIDDAKCLRDNMEAGRALVRRALADGCSANEGEKGRWIIKDVKLSRILEFLDRYHVNDAHKDLQPELTTGYLRRRSDERASSWNVAVIGSSRVKHKGLNGGDYTPGTIDLGLPEAVNKIIRARLTGVRDVADIKALMSTRDRAVDLDMTSTEISGKLDSELQQERRARVDGRGLLLLYPIARDSPPRSVTKTREALGAPEDVLGIGIVFPEPAGASDALVEEHTYVGLPEHLLEQEEESDELELARLREDDEQNAELDANTRLSELE